MMLETFIKIISWWW